MLAVATLQHFRRNTYSNAIPKDQIHQLEHSLSHIKQLLYHTGDGDDDQFRILSVALLTGSLCRQPTFSRVSDLFDKEAFMIYHPTDPNSLTFPNVAHWHIGICNVTRAVAKASHHGSAQWLARQCKIHGYPPIAKQVAFIPGTAASRPENRHMSLAKEVGHNKARALLAESRALEIRRINSDGGYTTKALWPAQHENWEKSRSLDLTGKGVRGDHYTRPIELDPESPPQETRIHAPPIQPRSVHPTDEQSAGVGSQREGEEPDLESGDIHSQQGESPQRCAMDELKQEYRVPRHVVQVAKHQRKDLHPKRRRDNGKEDQQSQHTAPTWPIQWRKEADSKKSLRCLQKRGSLSSRDKLLLLSGKLHKHKSHSSRRVHHRSTSHGNVQKVGGRSRHTCQTKKQSQPDDEENTLHSDSQLSAMVIPPPSGPGGI